jgi:23S rRNA pseudouridine2605 synthase
VVKGQRIAKVIARSGYCSRRDAEKLIEQGKVKINGEQITAPGINVFPLDKIEIENELIVSAEEVRLWLFYKPAGVITSSKDEQGRKTIYDILPRKMPRVITVGRLDINSEGLLLLTNSGELARKMELPSTRLTRMYRCRVFGEVTKQVIEQLKNGITVDGIRYGSILVEIERITGSNTWVKVSLQEGKNREIRKTFAYFGLQISRLIRVSFGEFELGDLKHGEIKEIPYNKVNKLIDKLGSNIS